MLSAIVIDDEPTPLKALTQLVERFCPEVIILRTCTDPHKAVEAILELQPELLLLDIEMPQLSGFDILEKIKGLAFPEVIFTTAHNQYAIRAFRYASVDYLLKPIDAAELEVAVARCMTKRHDRISAAQLDLLLENHRNHHKTPTLALPTRDGLFFTNITNIIYCEAEGAYTRFYIREKGMIIVSHHLGFYEPVLAEHHFFRIHDRYIVNLNEVERYFKGEGGQVRLSNGTVLDVSRRRKEGFLNKTKGVV